MGGRDRHFHISVWHSLNKLIDNSTWKNFEFSGTRNPAGCRRVFPILRSSTQHTRRWPLPNPDTQ
jgi:hypothetical protein